MDAEAQPRRKVLVVDDDRRLAIGLQEYFTKFLLQVRVAHSIASAQEEVRQDRFDVVVLDWILPDGNGRAVIEAIRSASPEAVVIVYSAHPTSDADCASLGADQFVLKSFDTTPVRNAVERGLSASRHNRVDRTIIFSNPVHHDVWSAVFQSLGHDKAPTSHALVQGPTVDVASRFAMWLVGRRPAVIPVVQIDACSSGAEAASPSNLFGSAQSQGSISSAWRRGLLDVSTTTHVLCRNSEHLTGECVELLLSAIRSGKFRRIGADRDLKMNTKFTFAGCYVDERSTTKGWQKFGDEESVISFRIPESPLSIMPTEEWIKRLPRNNLHSLRIIGRLLESLSPKACWSVLIQVFEGLSAAPHDFPLGFDWLARASLFEARVTDSASSTVVPWRAIADFPRQLYVAWLLARTNGNVAEASRQSGLTRAAIYKVLREV